MAEHVAGQVAGQASGTVEAHAAHELEHNPGRPVSWIGVGVVTLGFLIGGIAMVPHPTWWAFWLGAAVAVVGCIMLAVTKTFAKDWY